MSVANREQWDGLLPRQVHLRPAEPPAQLSDQEAEDGGHQQHEVSTSHGQEAQQGTLPALQEHRPGLDGSDDAFSRPGRSGCFCPASEFIRRLISIKSKENTPPSGESVMLFSN